jgi:alkylated DNA repair dioxygenase AlkB
MAQLTLFESIDTVLVDDERGRVTYTARFLEATTAAAWFVELRSAVSWRSERRMMYEREVDVPRLMASFWLDEPQNSLPSLVRDAAQLVIERLGVPFNSVGLNLYRDGRDSVAPHNDHLDEIRTGFPIALLSLGATRRMTIRAKEPPKRAVHVDLDPGSLLVMDYATQLHYTHGVPKITDPVGERISLAFRVKRPRANGIYR